MVAWALASALHTLCTAGNETGTGELDRAMRCSQSMGGTRRRSMGECWFRGQRWGQEEMTESALCQTNPQGPARAARKSPLPPPPRACELMKIDGGEEPRARSPPAESAPPTGSIWELERTGKCRGGQGRGRWRRRVLTTRPRRAAAPMVRKAVAKPRWVARAEPTRGPMTIRARALLRPFFFFGGHPPSPP